MKKKSEGLLSRWKNNNKLFADVDEEILFSSNRHLEPEKVTSKRTIGQKLWRVFANTNVRNAVKSGKLPKVSTLSCEHCGKKARDYHHVSYHPDDVLNVTPLCRSCHRETMQL